MTFLFCLSCGENPQDICDYIRIDTDCDGLTDNTETNGSNSHHNFDPQEDDTDPSIAHGEPWDGTLENGINLTNSGNGYIHYLGTDRIDTDDWGAGWQLVSNTEAYTERSGSDFSGPYYVGDLALQNGGYFTPHTSHRNGLDVDMRYVRVDRGGGPLNIATNPDDYDEDATANVLLALWVASEKTITHIFVDLDNLGFTFTGNNPPPLNDLSGHSNHFHVRIQDQDGII